MRFGGESLPSGAGRGLYIPKIIYLRAWKRRAKGKQIMKTKTAAGILFAICAVTPAMAGHNNPWATQDDTILSQNHDTNLLQSLDTPGEDEMLGVMVRNARGKLDGLSGGQRGKGGAAAHRQQKGPRS
jgi:hypothetical protein